MMKKLGLDGAGNNPLKSRNWYMQVSLQNRIIYFFGLIVRVVGGGEGGACNQALW